MIPTQETNQAIADDPDYFELQVWISYQHRYWKFLQDKTDTLNHILADVQQLRETHQQICEKIEELSRAYAHKKSPPHHAGSLVGRDIVNETPDHHPNLPAHSAPQKKTTDSGGDAVGRSEIKQHPESTSRLKFVNPICAKVRP